MTNSIIQSTTLYKHPRHWEEFSCSHCDIVLFYFFPCILVLLDWLLLMLHTYKICHFSHVMQTCTLHLCIVVLNYRLKTVKWWVMDSRSYIGHFLKKKKRFTESLWDWSHTQTSNWSWTHTAGGAKGSVWWQYPCRSSGWHISVALADINAVEVICSEGGVALRALPLTRVIARLDALKAEDVVALCQHSVLHPGVAAGTR